MLPSADVINKYLLDHFPGSPSVAEQSGGDAVLDLLYDENKPVQLELLGETYNSDELDPVCEHAWWWPEAGEAVSQHNSVLLIRMNAEGCDIVEAMVLLTILTSAVASLVDTAAIYWADGALINSTDYFTQEVARARSSQPPIPLTLWISLFLGEVTPGKLTLSTIGMSVFGYPELEVVDADCEVDQILQVSHSVALHMLETDIVHEDGETLELASGRKVSIHRALSIFNDEDPVLRLEIS